MKKKLTALILVAACLLSFGACGKKNASGDTSTDVSTENTANAEGVGIISLGNYKGLTVEVAKTTPSEAEIKNYSEYYYQMKAADMNWNRKAELGDTVVIDFEGKIDGETFEGGSAQDYTIVLGSHTFIDGFEDGMVGMAVGDVWDLDLQFPENYKSEEYAGKPVVFTVTCKSIVPPMSDETIAALQDENYSDQAEFEAYVGTLVESYYTEDYNTSVIAAVLEQILADSVIGTLPEDRMTEMKEYVIETYMSTAESYGVDIDTYFSYYGTTLEEMASVFVKRDLVFEAIAEAEGFTYTDDEVDAYVQQGINEIDDSVSLEELYAVESRDKYRQYMILDKVQEFLVANTVVNEPSTATETSGK